MPLWVPPPPSNHRPDHSLTHSLLLCVPLQVEALPLPTDAPVANAEGHHPEVYYYCAATGTHTHTRQHQA